MNSHSTDPPADEAGLVEAARRGDHDAYGRLYDRYADLIRAICFDRTHHVADAQDLCQEVFLQAYRKLPDLRRPDRFAPWLVIIARRACSDWLTKRSRERTRFTQVEQLPEPQVEARVYDDGAAHVHQALLELPAKERLAVQAFYLQGESVEHARRALRLSRSGLYRVLERGRKRLRTLLSSDGEDPDER